MLLPAVRGLYIIGYTPTPRYPHVEENMKGENVKKKDEIKKLEWRLNRF
jgi:hypothetical protein